jgi:hypothetical protein
MVNITHSLISYYIFTLISLSNIVSIKRTEYETENSQSVKRQTYNNFTDKNNNVLKISIYIISSITVHPIGLAVIPVIMSVSSYTTDVIL